MLKGNNFHHAASVKVGIVPQSVGVATVNGPDITEPWQKARQIAFVLMGGAFTGAVDGSFAIQGKKRSDGTYETIKDKAATPADLVLQGAKYDDAGALENGVLLASFDLSRVADSYSALRISYTNGAGTTALIAVAVVLYDYLEFKSGQADEAFALMHVT